LTLSRINWLNRLKKVALIWVSAPFLSRLLYNV
jgi:hypothetical protein